MNLNQNYKSTKKLKIEDLPEQKKLNEEECDGLRGGLSNQTSNLGNINIKVIEIKGNTEQNNES